MRTRVSISDTLQYLFSDQLGSTSVAANPDGTGALPTDYGFTGQLADDTGLILMGARYYDPSLNRFISADTIVPGAGNPQALNRYSYAGNNPTRYIDPSGHVDCDTSGNNASESCEGAGNRDYSYAGNSSGAGGGGVSESSDLEKAWQWITSFGLWGPNRGLDDPLGHMATAADGLVTISPTGESNGSLNESTPLGQASEGVTFEGEGYRGDPTTKGPWTIDDRGANFLGPEKQLWDSGREEPSHTNISTEPMRVENSGELARMRLLSTLVPERLGITTNNLTL